MIEAGVQVHAMRGHSRWSVGVGSGRGLQSRCSNPRCEQDPSRQRRRHRFVRHRCRGRVDYLDRLCSSLRCADDRVVTNLWLSWSCNVPRGGGSATPRPTRRGSGPCTIMAVCGFSPRRVRCRDRQRGRTDDGSPSQQLTVMPVASGRGAWRIRRRGAEHRLS